MKTVTNLLNVGYDYEMKSGNHRVRLFPVTQIRHFIYFSTVICMVDDNKKQFAVDDSHGSSSTKRACNAYRRELLAMGYTDVTVK